MNSGDVDEISGDGSTSPDLAAGSRLERFAADARDVFDEDVLRRLSVGDRAMLALVSRSMRDVVFDSPDGDVRDVAAVRRELGRMPNFVGSVSRLAWAKERGCPWDARICRYAAKGGHLEVLQWARANGAPWDKWTRSVSRLIRRRRRRTTTTDLPARELAASRPPPRPPPPR